MRSISGVAATKGPLIDDGAHLKYRPRAWKAARQAVTPEATPEKPFAAVEYLIRMPMPKHVQHSMATLFASIHPSAFDASFSSVSTDEGRGKPRYWPRRVLQGILSAPPDTASIIRIIPPVFLAVQAMHPKWATGTLRKLVEDLGECKMEVVLPVVVEQFLWLAETWAGESRGSGPEEAWAARMEELAGHYDRFLSAFVAFQPRMDHTSALISTVDREPLPQLIQHHIAGIVRHLVDTIRMREKQGDLASCSDVDTAETSKWRSSDAETNFTPLFSPALLKRLFSPAYLSSELCGALLAIPGMEQQMDGWHWDQCILLATRIGDKRLTKRCVYKKNALSIRDAADQQGHTTDGGQDIVPIPAGPRPRWEALDKLRISKTSSSRKLLEAVQPHIRPIGSTDSSSVIGGDVPAPLPKRTDLLAPHAWSMLLHQLSGVHQPRLSADDLVALASSVPIEDRFAATMTPIMRGLLERMRPMEAWKLWLALVRAESQCRAAAQAERDLGTAKHWHFKGLKQVEDHTGRYVDRIAFGLAVQIKAELEGLEGAVRMLDTWAWRPWMEASSSRATLPASKGPTANENQEILPDVIPNSIVLDTPNMNALLTVCKRCSSPSTAFRIWRAMYARYGVRPDSTSLTIILDIARYSRRREGVGERLREMARGFSLRGMRSGADDRDTMEATARSVGGDTSETHEYGQYDARGFARGDARVLLDGENGGWEGSEAPWQVARRIFRQVVLGNWPHLSDIKSPLELPPSAISSFFFPGDRPAQPHHSITSTSASISENGRTSKPSSQAALARRSQGPTTSRSSTNTLNLPLPYAKYTHLSLVPSTWHSFILLLGFRHLHAEIPVALAWMRALGVRPLRKTMAWAMVYVGEGEGPRRRIGREMVRDEEVLRRWLRDWVHEPRGGVEAGDGEGCGDGGEDGLAAEGSQGQIGLDGGMDRMSEQSSDAGAGGAQRSAEQAEDTLSDAEPLDSMVPSEEDVARLRKHIGGRLLSQD